MKAQISDDENFFYFDSKYNLERKNKENYGMTSFVYGAGHITRSNFIIQIPVL